jgi:hypothetical protein
LNHLPRRSLAYPPIRVPWTGCEYIGTPGQFHVYPELMGFDTEDLLKGEFGPHDEVEGLAFLQSWLFFGLLREALGDRAELIYKWWVEDYDSIESSPKHMMSMEMHRERYRVHLGCQLSFFFSL